MLFWREGGISVERYTNPDCKPEMEELMKDCPRSRSGAECWLRLCDIEDILGDEYDLERLRELAQADREGRCVVLPDGGCEDKDGENALKSAMNTCFYHNNPVTRFIADAVAEKLTRQEAEAALRREQE